MFRHRSRSLMLLSTESQRSITSPRTQPTPRSGNLKRTFSYLSVNILDYVGINPEGNVLKEDKVAKSRRVCYLTLFNRSDAKWRRNSCRGSFFSASGCTGFLTQPLEGSHYSDCVRNGVLSRYVLRSMLFTAYYF